MNIYYLSFLIIQVLRKLKRQQPSHKNRKLENIPEAPYHKLVALRWILHFEQHHSLSVYHHGPIRRIKCISRLTGQKHRNTTSLSKRNSYLNTIPSFCHYSFDEDIARTETIFLHKIIHNKSSLASLNGTLWQ